MPDPDLRQEGDAHAEVGCASRDTGARAAHGSGVDEPALLVDPDSGLVDGPMVVSEVGGVLRFTRVPWGQA